MERKAIYVEKGVARDIVVTSRIKKRYLSKVEPQELGFLYKDNHVRGSEKPLPKRRIIVTWK